MMEFRVHGIFFEGSGTLKDSFVGPYYPQILSMAHYPQTMSLRLEGFRKPLGCDRKCFWLHAGGVLRCKRCSEGLGSPCTLEGFLDANQHWCAGSNRKCFPVLAGSPYPTPRGGRYPQGILEWIFCGSWGPTVFHHLCVFSPPNWQSLQASFWRRFALRTRLEQ